MVVVRLYYWEASWNYAWVVSEAVNASSLFYSGICIEKRDTFGRLSCREGTFMLIYGL